MAFQHSSSSLAWNCLYSPLVLPNPTSLLSITVATVSSLLLLTLHLLGNRFVLSSILKLASDFSLALRGFFSLFYSTLFNSCSHSVIVGNIDSRKILDLHLCVSFLAVVLLVVKSLKILNSVKFLLMHKTKNGGLKVNLLRYLVLLHQPQLIDCLSITLSISGFFLTVSQCWLNN